MIFRVLVVLFSCSLLSLSFFSVFFLILQQTQHFWFTCWFKLFDLIYKLILFFICYYKFFFLFVSISFFFIRSVRFFLNVVREYRTYAKTKTPYIAHDNFDELHYSQVRSPRKKQYCFFLNVVWEYRTYAKTPYIAHDNFDELNFTIVTCDRLTIFIPSRLVVPFKT